MGAPREVTTDVTSVPLTLRRFSHTASTIVIFIHENKAIGTGFLERLPNVYGNKTLQMDGISDNVKRGTNFWGLYVRKMGYSYFLGLKA